MTNLWTAGRRPPTHPGELLAEVVLPALKAEQGVTKVAFAAYLGMTRKALENILKGESAITPATAVRLGVILGNGPGLWLRMQAAYDLHKAEEQLAGELAALPRLHAA